jgi:2',3'-cyclic-nucleotide 2'-phosphodiesterase (5'-nucleotidase family)
VRGVSRGSALRGVSILFTAQACAYLAPQPTATPAPTAAPTPLPKKPLALTILHTNDVEGFLNPCG